MPILLDILLHVYFICSLQLMLVSIITPKYFAWLAVSVSVPSIKVVTSVSDAANIVNVVCVFLIFK